MNKELDLEYLCTVIGNMAGVPIRIYRNGKKQFYHSLVSLPKDPILLCEKELSDAKSFLVDFPEDLIKNKRCYEKVGFTDTGKRLTVQPNLVLACYEKFL